MSAPTCLSSALLRSARFDHGFSVKPLDFRGDSPEAMEAISLVLRLGGRPRLASQVHGTRAIVVHAGDDASREEADALVAIEPGVAVAVRVADCVPILLADSKSGAVAAVHAGWRGLVNGVIESAMDAHAFDLAAIGPCIGACCFEIGDDVAAKLRPFVVRNELTGRTHGDLRAAARARLVARNVQNANIDDVASPHGCTKCDPAMFHSFRRDGERAGRQLAVIETRRDAR